ncbi:MAG: hypothetical protein LBN22_02420 [Clostridiales Family XIII bacterium]|jgi:hypothetical protein|nr:hypothetical protein [Clostridiales Family XIII bacterium]
MQWLILIPALPAVIYFLRSFLHDRTQEAFGVIVISGYIWAFGQQLNNIIYLYILDELAFEITNYITYIGLSVLEPTCVYLAWCYCGDFKKYLSKPRVALLYGINIMFFLSMITNPMHGLFYKSYSLSTHEYNILFYLFYIYNYICVLYSIIRIMIHKLDMNDRSHPILLIIAFVPPTAGNAYAWITQNHYYDFAAISYVVMLIAAFIYIKLQCPFLIAPITAKQVLHDLSNNIKITDANGVIIYDNERPINPTHIYKTDQIEMQDHSTLRVQTDITNYIDLVRETEEISIKQKVIQDTLQKQSELLEKLSEQISEIATQEAHNVIASKLNEEVRGRLHILKENTDFVIENLNPQQIEEVKTYSIHTLEIVRQIIRDVKRGQNDL